MKPRIRSRFEGLWDGTIDPLEDPPFSPMLAWEEIAPGAMFVSSFANATAISTDDGLILVDTGSFMLSTQVFVCVREWSTARVNAAIYTHGHVDHVFGTERYEAEAREHGWPALRVVGHEDVAKRFDRYKRTRGYNACINSRQFQSPVEWPADYRYPDLTYRDALAFDVGGVRIELEHARGETDDATWVWVPERELACVGDLFIWASPNAGNPQKVQRYPRDWADALRRIAAKNPEILCPGHGLPIWGKERVRRALTETAELLESICDQTLRLMNDGARLDDAIHEVRAPAALLERPYLRPFYDEPEFIVRNVWRLYGGWWDGNPANLKPAPRRALAREIAGVAGGAGKLAERAEALLASGDTALACHLVEMACDAAPEDAGVWSVRRRAYAQREREATSLMAKGVYSAASEERPRSR
jgi:alkyl sulfatase BDS1-like metallo-beta-lactamase superfamily hydrolase